MFYVTDITSDIHAIACEFESESGDDYRYWAKRIYEANQTVFNLQGVGDIFPPWSFIYIPDDEYFMNPAHVESILLHLNRMPNQARANLRNLIRSGNIAHHVSMSKLTVAYNHHRVKKDGGHPGTNKDNDDDLWWMLGATTAFETGRSYADLRSEYYDAFNENMDELNEMQEKLMSDDKEIARAAWHEYKEVYPKATKEINRAVKRMSEQTMSYFKSKTRSLKMLKNKNTFVVDLEDIGHFKRLGVLTKSLKVGGYIGAVVWGGAKVINAYESSKDWEAKTFGVAMELGSTELAGIGTTALIAALELTPVGWVMTLGVAAAEAAALAFGGGYVEHKAEELYEWAEKTWKKWF